jgi:multisubunit Na+/H+ antiporter MnhC subunit
MKYGIISFTVALVLLVCCMFAHAYAKSIGHWTVDALYPLNTILILLLIVIGFFTIIFTNLVDEL